ncbi:helix-turn-helix domain-containing protein [Marinigracilibium pacificum]|uniref:AraC family transcriptional regulator n=1 Tax=Marinigracilibium pacificum TaxID=2729599 RepID=A0A848IY50_9BACT|nr:AraC family transcriptional regulator [Marinigracilibium pacificum]
MYFNLFNLLIFFGVFQGIILGVVLLSLRKKGDMNTIFLSCLIFSLSLSIGKHLIIDLYKENEWGHALILPVSCFLLMGPFLYFYVKTTLGKKIIPGKNLFLHLLPGLIFLIIQIVIFINTWISNSVVHQSIISFFQLCEQGLGLISLVVYGILSLKKVIRYQKAITDYYSNIEYITLQWLINLLIALFLGWLLILFMTLIDLIIYGFTLPQSAYYFVFIYIGIIIHYFGLRKLTMTHFPILRPLEQINTTVNDNTEEIEEERDDAKVEIEKLEEIMVTEKPYLDPNLTLDSLSEMVGIHSKKLSTILNQKMNTSFYDFINTARVEEVKRKINDSNHSHLTILGIALESGFNSKSSFNAIFKKYTGMTPREFKNQKPS